MFRGILDRLRKIRQRKAIILMYHQVCTRRCDPWELAVHPNHFYDQLDYLKKNFHVVPIGSLADGAASHRFKKTIAITFDDGFKDNYTNAAPLLDWHGLPAAFYVSTTAVAQPQPYWWDALQEIIFHSDVLPESFELMIGQERVQFTFHTDRVLNSRLRNQLRSWNYNLAIPNERITLYMQLWHHLKSLSYAEQKEVLAQIKDWSRCREIDGDDGMTMSVREVQILSDNPLFSVGAHTVHHSMLSMQKAEDQAFEVQESKSQIEKWLGKPVDGFAYPYGNFNNVTQGLLKETGFRYAVSTESRPVSAEDDPFALPRIQVKNWCVYEFASKLNEMVHE